MQSVKEDVMHLSNHEHLLAAIVENSADGIVAMDEHGRIQSWNRGAEMIFGHRAADITGQHNSRLASPHAQARGDLAHIKQQLLQTGVVRNFETEGIRRDGQTVPLQLSSTLLYDDQQHLIGSACIFRDVTPQKRWQAQLEQLVAERTRELRVKAEQLQRANEELQQLDRLKDEFVSLVSHELRAPLTNLNGSLDLMRGGCAHPNFTCQQMFHIMDEQIMRLARLVQGVLNVSRIEAGQLTLRYESVDLQRIAQKTLESVGGRSRIHQFKLSVNEPLPLVMGDPDRLEEVVLNLVDNAIKYSPDGGPITLQLGTVNGAVQLSVSDAGMGIPTNEIERVFEKFHRVDGADDQAVYGHGLGLYISKKLVEAHGGDIQVESQVGLGTKFRVRLPINADQKDSRD
jgi:PAS domain S-box-containing protein